MKKILFFSMFLAFMTIMTCCTTEDPFDEYMNGNNEWYNGGNMFGGNGSSATTGEIATFDIAIDTKSAEGTTNAEEYFPEEEDAL